MSWRVIYVALGNRYGIMRSAQIPNREDVYKIIVRFHGQETKKIVTFPKIEDVMINVGYFKSDVVGDWL